MHKVTLSLNIIVLICLLMLSITGCASSTPSTTARVSTPESQPVLHATITILRAQDLFDPFILTIQPHTMVIWHNADTIAHTFTTTSDAKDFLNPEPFSFNVAAGKSVQLLFTRPGLYHYYENKLGTWKKVWARVAAEKGTPSFPLAMDGVIWVQGPLSGLPSAALNKVPTGHDEFATEFVAIGQFGSVSWHNFDEDPHFIGLVPGWSAPINPADIGIYRIAGTADVPGGQTVTVFFNTPGLYYYYCRNHDRINTLAHRAQTLTKASEYPLPMEGFVLVSS